MAWLSPVERLDKDHRDCIHCGSPYDATTGGLVWHGKERQYIICVKCAGMVVAGLANDLAEALYPEFSAVKRPSEHYIPYFQRAAHAIQVKHGQRHWAEVMDKKGEISNFMCPDEK